MGHVPTHGPYCYKRASYPTRCRSCKAEVIYFECTCGSKVFLVPGSRGETHDCRKKINTSPPKIDRRTGNSTDLMKCPFCFARLRPDRYAAHIARCRR